VTTTDSHKRPYGLHPLAFAALLSAGIPISRVGQTIGICAASAGTHEKDGEYEGHDYAACTDLHVGDLDDAGVHGFCDKLAGVGFCPFFRKPGYDGWPSQDARHVHAIWPGAPMKEIVRAQVHDYLAGRNGLASHIAYPFRPPTPAEEAVIRQRFLSNNPAEG